MEVYYTPYGAEGAEIFFDRQTGLSNDPPPSVIGDLLPVVGLGGVGLP